ncbi:uncharacterized protein LOC123501709, partial [Portunus trituberculatus]|uniref:uncharacterized protein LOC123501709 n=1 Tax=Portunus trituberculatus TaxID=210409 RepID=UPI001E1D014F
LTGKTLLRTRLIIPVAFENSHVTMRLWVVIAVLLGAVSYGSTLFLPLNGAIPLPLVIGPGPIIVALLWILKVGGVSGDGGAGGDAVDVRCPRTSHTRTPRSGTPPTRPPRPGTSPPEHHAPEHPPPGHHVPEHPPPPHHAPPAHEHTVDHAEGVSSYSHLRKRSLEDLQTEGIVGDLADESLEEAEEMLWNTALKWDPTGCSMKLLCHLQELPQGNATMEESVLAYLFSHAPQQYCLQSFPACPMSGGELRYLLQQI